MAGERGAAVVVVLLALGLLLIVSLAFLASVTTERQASAAFAGGSEVRLVADAAVNLVMGQIREATEGTDEVWTSQPGALRTFGLGGEPNRVFKLYSSSELSPAAAGFDPASDVPADWASRPSAYVDLNRPVAFDRDGASGNSYPILDPRAEGMVEGFSPDPTNGVAMPVEWIYLTEDGTTATAETLTATNPPIARMAFWTDDETAKLNINTASEGNYWEVPKTGSPEDVRFADNQPAQREFQSYPGHPATTSLGPVLWEYFAAKDSSLTRNQTSSGATSFPEVLYDMLPRTSSGGSRGGTVKLAQSNGSLPLETDRLFSSVDELAFLPSEPGDAERQENTFFDRDTIEQVRFFLTAHSRAPELNLWNLPRLSVWPIHENDDALHRTPFDNLIAFASTINDSAYYFTRADSRSPTADFSGRNVELYQYLQRLTGEPVPGFGGNFLTKYGPDRNQILTQIFDYVRCVNLIDSSTGDPNFETFTPSSYSPGVLFEGKSALAPTPGLGQVVPIAPVSGPAAGTRGFGRYKTINRAILVIAASAATTTTTTLEAALFFELFSPSQGHTVFAPDLDVVVTTPTPFEITSGPSFADETTFAFSGSNRVNTFPSTGLSKNAGGYEGFNPSSLFVDANISGNSPAMRTKSPTQAGLRLYPFVTQPFTVTGLATDDDRMRVDGGTVRVELRTGGVVVQTLNFQFSNSVLEVKVPQLSPHASLQGFANRFLYAPTQFATGVAPIGSNRFYQRGAASDWWLTENDFVRSLEPTGFGGDLRLLAARGDSGSFFEPIADHATVDATNLAASRVFTAQAAVSEGAAPEMRTANGNRGFGRIVRDAKSEASIYDEDGNLLIKGKVTPSWIPASINGVVNADGAPGDFDTGIGLYPNGPFINKPDDGNSPTLNPDNISYTPYMLYDQYSLPPGQTFSSPSRQMPSAVMFGSLPTGVLAGEPWQTLLFNPVPASLYGAGSAPHPGQATPPDHLLLDLFHMPVVEPYAISEPFSTAGKVNMNYEIVPFRGIQRSTGIRGVLDAARVVAINDALIGNQHYKKGPPSNIQRSFRYPIDAEQTLAEFEQRFATNGAFLSASEICGIPLIPDVSTASSEPFPWTTPVTAANLDDFWEFHRNTGDNLRELPYATIYPRLTTRSNTFTVHVWVQTLQKLPGTDPGRWVEGDDRVTGEFRGSYTIERYLNPSQANLPDYATDLSARNLNAFYRFRVIHSSQFAP